MNISKDLRRLFFSWLDRIEYERTHFSSSSNSSTVGNYPIGSSCNIDDGDDLDGILYFYEWSDITNVPKQFFSLKSFINFLLKSGIYLASYQLELIRNIHSPYVACKKGSRDVIIKCSYDALKEALCGDEKKEDKEPYNVQVTRPPINNAPKVLSCSIYAPYSSVKRPNMIMEVDNNYPYMEEVGSWFG